MTFFARPESSAPGFFVWEPGTVCTVSMIGDHYRDKWNDLNRYPYIQPFVQTNPLPQTNIPYGGLNQFVTRAEFDALKAEVKELRELLKRAKEYDERNGEPDCQVDEKMDVLRRVAKLVGVNLDDVIGKQAEGART